MTINLLNQSFIYNQTITNRYTLNAEEIRQLIDGVANIEVVDQNIKILIDLGTQKAVDKLIYTYSGTSNDVIVEYGRDLENTVSGVVDLTASGIEVKLDIEDYKYPRYVYLTHYSTGFEFTASGLQITNIKDDIRFGKEGTQEAVTIVPKDEDIGLSDPVELIVTNSGTLTSNMYVGIDTTNLDLDIFSRIELSPTVTGTFGSVNEELTMPNAVPWEWGVFTNTTIDEENKLILKDSTTFTVPYEPNTRYTLNVAPPDNGFSPCSIPAKNSIGRDVIVTVGNTTRIIIINPINGGYSLGAEMDPLPGNNIDERGGHGLAWDGNDRVYFLRNSASPAVIRYYQISTNSYHQLGQVTFYARASRWLCFKDGFLYAAGVQNSPGAADNRGTRFYRVNVDTLEATELQQIPYAPQSGATPMLVSLNDHIYYIGTVSVSTQTLWRYHVSSGLWENLGLIPYTFAYNLRGLSADPVDKSLIHKQARFGTGGTTRLYKFNTITGAYTLLTEYSAIADTVNRFACQSLSLPIIYVRDSSSTSNIYITRTVPPIALDETVEGQYLSPIFKVHHDKNYHNILMDYLKPDNFILKYDESLGVDNFIIRGSNEPPASDNFIESFAEDLNPELYDVQTLNESSYLVSEGMLHFNHNFIDSEDTPYNSAYAYNLLPFNTAGSMQYKFWWFPRTAKSSGIEMYPTFYIVPYVDLVTAGALVQRDPENLRRLGGDYIFLRLGADSDTAGQYTQVRLWDGQETKAHSIVVSADRFYEICLLINWNLATYKIVIDGIEVGSGNIPVSTINLLRPQHSFEIFSAGRNVSFQEKFKYITINRLGTVQPDLSDQAIPVHREDPLYGLNGSLDWHPVTVNSALIPKYEYVQFSLRMRATGGFDIPAIKTVQFPKVLKLEQVVPGESRRVYLRYNFPPQNNLYTNVVNLKTWMFTDKK